MGHSGFQSLKGDFRSHTHSHDSNEIFRARPFIAFLYSPIKERPDFGPAAYIETSHPYRPIKGIRGKAEQIDSQLLYINGHDPDRVHCIGMENDLFFFGDPGDRFVAGDWGVADGVETPAVFRPANAMLYFRNTLTPGNADFRFEWTGAEQDWVPVSGDFERR